MRLSFARAMLIAAAPAAALPAAGMERAQIPENLTWNLSEMYPSAEAWKQAKEAIAKSVPELARFKGHLGDSPATLYDALAAVMKLDLQLSRLNAYANQLYDQDTRVSSALEMQQAARQLSVEFGSAAAFLRPEILALDAGRVRDFVAKDKRLAEYKFFLDDILRWKSHTLSASEEKLVAQSGNLSDAGYAIYSIFTNADLPYPEVKLTTGERVRLDAAAYTKYRAAKNRKDREAVFKAFWARYQEFARTLGTSLYAQVKAHLFEKSVRNFGASLEASLFENAVPVAVYKQLIADVHQNLPTLHRYLKLRQRMMGLSELRYYDLYAPIVKEVEMKYTPEQGMALTLESFAPLGKDYVETLKKGYENRWVDFLPSTGKRSGAYSNGVYDVHPYQLLNFMGQYEDVSTLAHESGHSMHTYLSQITQPYATYDYPIFVAEVASTLNENLLLYHVLGQARDDATRLFLLGSYLDNLRQTLFRQTLFAEFELRIHEMAEKGETLTGDNLSKVYLDLLKQYYGDAQGIVKIDDLYGVEWAYIPHFYYNFYVYQYATSLIASTSIAKAIREETARGETKARDAYVKMLAAGGSKYAIDLLKGAGVDMTTSAPFAAAMAEMNRTMDEMEVILAKGGKSAKASKK